MPCLRTKRAGKAVGGGKLTHVFNGKRLVGTIVESSVGVISHRVDAPGKDFGVHDTKTEALRALGHDSKRCGR